MLALAACGALPGATPVEVVVHVFQLTYDLEKLLTESEAIAIVEVSSTEDRVNNSANRLQDVSKDRVYHESALQVVESLRGIVPAEVRQTGGSVEGFTYRFEDQALLKQNDTYLLFLTDWLWPFDDRLEAGTGITGGNAGMFTSADGETWSNEFGVTVTLKELQDLIRQTPNDPDAGAPMRPEDVESMTQP
jgi:hypothetical protein